MSWDCAELVNKLVQGVGYGNSTRPVAEYVVAMQLSLQQGGLIRLPFNQTDVPIARRFIVALKERGICAAAEGGCNARLAVKDRWHVYF
jgi:hypothetical protein